VGVLVVRLRPWRQLNPGMSATVIDRILRWRKAWVGEGAHGDTHRRLFVTFLGVEHGCSADRAEPELEPGSLVTNANVLRCGAIDLVRCREAGKRRKDVVHPELQCATVHRNKRLFENALAPRGMLFAPALMIEGK
jgi:hypothetical protein